MKRLRLMMISLFLATSMMIPHIVMAANENDVILYREENKQNDDKPRQRMPAYSPVYCQVGADHVIFFCRHEAVGEISVTDADGAVIATAVAELSAGLTVMLPGGVTPGMTLRATIGDVTYSATI
ncbi:MAG: hypothetical protein K2K40_07265 [Paramuribaculum sp.]|nr:hypothetical protein [Paramuribaculum sp.]